MSRLRAFSAIYGGISRVKRHHSGAVGKVLGKDLGNRSFPLRRDRSARHKIPAFVFGFPLKQPRATAPANPLPLHSFSTPRLAYP
jgi:hypothetical protein